MIRIFFLALIIPLLPALLLAHPAGNLVVAGDYLLWPYVYPADDAQHHSSVLIWDGQSPVRPLITSQFAGSNYLLYARRDTVYYIESRDSQTENKSYFRVLKGKAGEKPVEIWPWRTDEWRVGNNGFYAVDDEEIIFSLLPRTLEQLANFPVTDHPYFLRQRISFLHRTDNEMPFRIQILCSNMKSF